MKLQGQDFKNLVNQILDSYPDIKNLDMLVRFELDIKLNEVVSQGNNRQKVFEFIEWIESDNRLTKKLIKALVEDHPQNQFFQEINDKLNPSILRGVIEPSSDNAQPITNSEWNQLYLILSPINNNVLFTQIAKETLKNKHNDLLGNCLDLDITLDGIRFKKIFLEKFPKRNDNVPTILEFAERLKDNQQIDSELSNRLEEWIEKITTRLNICLPTYSKSPVNKDIHKYFLLITIIPKGKNQFELEPDLLLYNSSEDSYQPIPKFLNSEQRSLIKCDFTEIKEKVFDLVQICQDYLQFPYIVNIELFLTYPYLGHAFDLEEIVIDRDRNSHSYLGIEYPLLVSSYDRFNNKSYYNEFLLRWCINVKEKLKSNLANLMESLKELETYNYQNLDELVNQWRVEQIIGLKIIGCWSEEKEVQEKLFYSVVRSGIPLALWIRCNDLPNCSEKLNNLLKLDQLKNWHDLFEWVRDCRRSAYENELGYHLGILSDDPRRIPSHFKPLIETGK